MKITTLFFAAASLFATSAFAELNLLDLKRAADVALESFHVEYPDHFPHISGYATAISGDDTKVTITIAHHGHAQDFKYLCLKIESGVECQAEEN